MIRITAAFLLLFSLISFDIFSPSHAADYPGEYPACLNPQAGSLPNNCIYFDNAKKVIDLWVASTSVTNYLVCGPNFFSGYFYATYTHKNNIGSCTPTRDTRIVNTDPFFKVTYSTKCPVGLEWFESENSCLQSCSSRNPSTGSEGMYGRWTPYSPNRQTCNSGCIWRPEPELERKTSQVCGPDGQCSDAQVLTRNVWMYSGAQCPAENPPPPPPSEPDKEPGCTTAGSGQTFCMMPNGDSCHSVSGGRTICWKQGEQGTKTDGPNTQSHFNGNEIPSPPEGSKHTNTTKTETTKNNNSSTTTTNNYTTNNGGPAGSTNSGQDTDSNGKPKPGNSTPGGNEGDNDEGKENGSTGGGDCDTPPIGSGDAALAQIATQTWQTRCVIESRNKELDSDAESLAGASDGLEGVSVSDIYDESSLDFSQISESLLGGSSGTCSFGVSLQLMGKPIELPPEFWELASFIRMLIIALAYIWVAQQLTSD